MAKVPPPSIELLKAILPLRVRRPDPKFLACLAPITAARMQVLSVGRGEAWPGTLYWRDQSIGLKVAQRLRSVGQGELDGYVFLGYARLDEETLVSEILIAGAGPKLGLEVEFVWIVDEPSEPGLGAWKIMGVQPQGDSPPHDWYQTIESAEAAYARLINEDVPDDGYWNIYDRDAEAKVTDPILNASYVDGEADDAAYYQKHAEVEPQLGHGDEKIGSGSQQSRALQDHVQTSIQSLARLAVAHRTTRAQFARMMQTGLQDIAWPSENET